eukprot:s77_g19.t3
MGSRWTGSWESLGTRSFIDLSAVEVRPSTAAAKPEEAVTQPAAAVAGQVADEVRESLSSPENEEKSLPPALIQAGASQENPFGLPKTEPDIQKEEPAVLLAQPADGSPSRLSASASSPGSPESPRDLVVPRSPGSPSSASPLPAEAESPRGSASSPPRGRSGGAGKPPPPPPKKETPPPLPLPKREEEEQPLEALLPAESASLVAGAIDEILSRPRAKRPLRQSLAETLEARQSLIDANADDEGRLSSFGRRADEGNHKPAL